MDQQQPAGSAGIALPAIRRPSDDFERWRFDIEDLLIETENNLQGYYWDYTRKEWVKQGKARMNEEGAKVVRRSMSSVINKVSSLTTLDLREILIEVRILTLSLNRMFFLNHERYGIETPTDASDILWQVAFLTLNGLKQSQGALALKSLAETSQTVRYHHESIGQRKSGHLGFLKRGSKEEGG